MHRRHHPRIPMSFITVAAAVTLAITLASEVGAQARTTDGAGANGAGHAATAGVDAAPTSAASTSAMSADSTTVAATARRYHEALGRGDSAAALALLTPDAIILESGGLEMLAEYRAHHLPADIEFARAVPEERSPIRVVVRGDAAWAASTTTAKGTFRGRAVDSAGAELMVLTRTADGWRIAAIHWSSRRRN